jgi:hypothetical protein
MPRVAKGYIEQLPSGSFRVSVYAGTDPLTRRAIRLKATAKTEQQAHIELGRLLKEASEGRTPESNATVAKLLDEIPATSPDDVAKVIAEARGRSTALAGGFDLRNTAARLGHSGGGATTLRHYADPVPEVDRRAAAYLARLTAGHTSQDLHQLLKGACSPRPAFTFFSFRDILRERRERRGAENEHAGGERGGYDIPPRGSAAGRGR